MSELPPWTESRYVALRRAGTARQSDDGHAGDIGIEPGRPFNPPAKYRAAMEKGIVDAYYYMQILDRKLFPSNLYWPDRPWSFVMAPDAREEFRLCH